MKTCPQCAEQVQDAAKVCRYCGHSFSFWPKSKGGLGCTGVLGLLIFLVMIALTTGIKSTPAPAPAVAAPLPYPNATITQCADLLKQARGAGIVREARADYPRIDVEERLWAELPAAAKRSLAQAVGCLHFGRPLAAADLAVVYGYRSGKRLAMATSAGVSLE